MSSSHGRCSTPLLDPRPNRSFTRSPEVDASAVGDRVVLYHRSTRSALVLNPTATRLWALLDVPRTTGDLVAELRERFPDVTEEQASVDVVALLDDLQRKGLVASDPRTSDSRPSDS